MRAYEALRASKALTANMSTPADKWFKGVSGGLQINACRVPMEFPKSVKPQGLSLVFVQKWYQQVLHVQRTSVSFILTDKGRHGVTMFTVTLPYCYTQAVCLLLSMPLLLSICTVHAWSRPRGIKVLCVHCRIVRIHVVCAVQTYVRQMGLCAAEPHALQFLPAETVLPMVGSACSGA